MKKRISKIIRIGSWILVSSGVLVLLLAAIRVRQHQVCRGYLITIRPADGQSFLTEKEIAFILKLNGDKPVKGKRIAIVGLKEMEAQLEKNPWIADAELYFDNNQYLRVLVREKEPVARVFSLAGESFYIDSACSILPLSSHFSVQLPVFTGYPYDSEKPGPEGKKLLRQVKILGEFIRSNPFWMDQTGQVDIRPNGQFFIYPVVGNPVIEFGDASSCESKFNRLSIFYQKVLSRTGLTYYDTLRVKFQGQVVAVRNSRISFSGKLQAPLGISVIKGQVNRAGAQAIRANPFKTFINIPAVLSLPKYSSQQIHPLKNPPYDYSVARMSASLYRKNSPETLFVNLKQQLKTDKL